MLDPDGDIVRWLKRTGQGVLSDTWACYHSDLYEFDVAGARVGVVGCAVGAPYAVLIAEQMFSCGCQLLISITSSGQITRVAEPPYFVLVTRALRDEGTSYHYLPPARFADAPTALLHAARMALLEAGVKVLEGASWTTDAPFRETKAAVADAEREGILAVEMETAALYAFAAARNKAVLCVAHVTNTMGLTEREFEKGQDDGVVESLRVIAGLVGYPLKVGGRWCPLRGTGHSPYSGTAFADRVGGGSIQHVSYEKCVSPLTLVIVCLLSACAGPVHARTADAVAMSAALEPECRPQFAPLHTGTSSTPSSQPLWRKEDAGEWDGDGWLGWTHDGDALVPVSLTVRDWPKERSEDADEVAVYSVPDVAFAVRCIEGLRAGNIRSAGVGNHDLSYRNPLRIGLGLRRYQLALHGWRGDLADAQVELTDGQRTQVLYSADGFVDEPHFYVVWAGDLDGDGELDLVVNFSRKYSMHPYRLLLSSLAAGGELVGEAATFLTYGC